MRNDRGPSRYARFVLRRHDIVKASPNLSADEVSQSSTPSERIVGSIRDHAERTGEHKDKLHRALKRGKGLGEDILQKTEGTTLDKDVELDALLKKPVEQRNSLAARAAAGELVSARTPDGRPRERKRNQQEPCSRALCNFQRWRKDNPCVEDIAQLKRPISKIEAVLSSDDPNSAQSD